MSDSSAIFNAITPAGNTTAWQAFPLPVKETQVVLMEVDTQHLHAYWHIAPSSSPAVWHLRLYTEAGELVQEQAIDAAQQHCYLDNLDSGAVYQASLGGYEEAQWQEAARSNLVQLPTRLPQLAYAFPPFAHEPLAQAAKDNVVAPVELALLPEFPNLVGMGSLPPAPDLSQTSFAAERVCALAVMTAVRQARQLPTLASLHLPAFLPPSTPPAPRAAPLILPTSQALALETFLGLSSQPLAVELQLQAELKLSGQAPLHSNIHLFGKPLEQDAQGRFSLSLPLNAQLALQLLKKMGDT